MNKVIILGKGYIGNYLKRHLERYNCNDVIHISKKDVNYENPIEFQNFLNINYCSDWWVINCTGFTGTPNVDGCEDYKQECYHYNVTVPLYITKVCNDMNMRVIHIGSGCVYSGYDKIYTEEEHINQAKVSESVKQVYKDLRERILNIGGDINIVPLKSYVAYKRKTNFFKPLSLKNFF